MTDEPWQKATCEQCGITYYGFKGQKLGKLRRQCRSQTCWPKDERKNRDDAPIRIMLIENVNERRSYTFNRPPNGRLRQRA